MKVPISSSHLLPAAAIIGHTAGDLMVGTGGARKFRMPGGGKGKRGGYRVITYFAARHPRVHSQRLC
jgi:hypothetical protein